MNNMYTYFFMVRKKGWGFWGVHSMGVIHPNHVSKSLHDPASISMSQEVCKWLGSVGDFTPNIPHLYVGYNPFTNH